MKKYFGLILIFLLIGCATSKKLEYSFFIAGHAYGDPRDQGKEKGLYKPFKEKFQYINDQKKLEYGFLLGDVVWTHNAWPEALEDISKIEAEVFVARGNHDGPLKTFEKNFGKSYKKFIKDDALFIILDPNLDKWNISDDQLVFLMNTLRNDGRNVKNIFIFSHQLLWYNKENYALPAPNSTYNRSETTNFWTKIEPLLKAQNCPVYLFAGDVGAFSKEYRKKDHIIEYYYHNYDNITFVASGMGGGKRDNIVIVDVFNDNSVELRLIHLNGSDINSLGNLKTN